METAAVSNIALTTFGTTRTPQQGRAQYHLSTTDN